MFGGTVHRLSECRTCDKYEPPSDRPEEFSFSLAPARKSLTVLSVCGHLGGATGKTVGCVSCGGSVKLKLFACAVHGECTPEKAVTGVACCAGCPDHTGHQVSRG